MKAPKQLFQVCGKVFIMLYNVVLTLYPQMKSESKTTQMKTTEQCFRVVMFLIGHSWE